jgi:hypothetical protein
MMQVRERCEIATVLTLKTEEGATSRGMQVALGTGKGKEPPEGIRPSCTLILEMLASRTVG